MHCLKTSGGFIFNYLRFCKAQFAVFPAGCGVVAKQCKMQ